MRRLILVLCGSLSCLQAQSPIPLSPTPAVATSTSVLPLAQLPSQNLLNVHRVYVGPLAGGAGASSLRELIIASLDGTRLFTLTDSPERADAILKGAADDHTYVDALDTDKALSDHTDLGIYSGGSRGSSKSGGGYSGMSAADRESHHIRERKHEAYATVRLCNRAGDVIWSTTQESLGGKFRGASADVAMKIARQILADYDAARQAPPR